MYQDLEHQVSLQVGEFFPLVTDVRLSGTKNSLPLPLILDFQYGMAVYKHWGCEQSEGVLVK